jgi:3-methyladenine DNA glycosylase/8-oxoguanine DNA glycosylase
MTFSVGVPEDFHFWRTVYSHGWCSLPPFSVDHGARRLRLTLRLSSGTVAAVSVRPSGRRRLQAESSLSLRAEERREIRALLRSCFRLDEDFSEFYAEANRHPRFRWIPGTGSGRLLRSPTVFEDVVKMICTTNCSWALTEIMVKNLCTTLGANGRGSGHAFPVPEAIADCSEPFLRKKIRAGYRAPYLLELARRVVNRSIDPESWRRSTQATEELFGEVRSVKGVGPYAAGNVLKLLGRYDYLGLDSWCRKRFYELHRKGRRVSDKAIGKFYAPFGKWRGLFFWMDLTKDWHADKKTE